MDTSTGEVLPPDEYLNYGASAYRDSPNVSVNVLGVRMCLLLK